MSRFEVYRISRVDVLTIAIMYKKIGAEKMNHRRVERVRNGKDVAKIRDRKGGK